MSRYALIALIVGAFALSVVDSTLFKFHRNNKPRLDQEALERLFSHESDGTYGRFIEDKESPIANLYYKYVETLDPWFKSRPSDNKLNYAPSAANCSELFERTDDGTGEIDYLHDVVVMDACLGIIDVKTEGKFTGHEGLRRRYSTRFWEFEQSDRTCIYDMFIRYYELVKRDGINTCNREWLKMYNDFADCRSESFKKGTDPYVEMLYQVIRRLATNCFSITHSMMAQKLVEIYRSEHRNHITVKARDNSIFRKFLSEATRQSGTRAWPRTMMRILQVLKGQDYSAQIDLMEVQRVLALIKLNKQYTVGQVENSITAYFVPRINKVADKTKQSNSELIRHQVVDGLCNRFARKPEDPSLYDFYSNMLELIRPTQYPEIFGISPEQFVIDVLNDKIKPLYFSIFTCQIFYQTKMVQKKGKTLLGFKEKYLDSVAAWPMPSTDVFRRNMLEDEHVSDYVSEYVDLVNVDESAEPNSF